MGGCFLLFSEYFPVITGFGVCIDIRIHRHFSNFFLRTQYWTPWKKSFRGRERRCPQTSVASPWYQCALFLVLTEAGTGIKRHSLYLVSAKATK